MEQKGHAPQPRTGCSHGRPKQAATLRNECSTEASTPARTWLASSSAAAYVTGVPSEWRYVSRSLQLATSSRSDGARSCSDGSASRWPPLGPAAAAALEGAQAAAPPAAVARAAALLGAGVGLDKRSWSSEAWLREITNLRRYQEGDARRGASGGSAGRMHVRHPAILRNGLMP